MYCPFCAAQDTKVIDSRLVADGGQVRRRRECLSCTERFTTFETAELVGCLGWVRRLQAGPRVPLAAPALWSAVRRCKVVVHPVDRLPSLQRSI